MSEFDWKELARHFTPWNVLKWIAVVFAAGLCVIVLSSLAIWASSQ
jgi:hypothetical protein